MGLFMNDQQHPGLFKNSGRLVDNNQAEYRSDYFSEIIREQQTANQLIQRTIQALKNAQNRANQRQIQDWKTVDKQFIELKELHSQHEQIEKQVMDWLQKLEARHTELHVTVTDEQLGIQNLINQVNDIRQSQTALETQLLQITGTNDDIVQRLDHYNAVNDDVANQLQQMGRTNEQLVEKLNEQHTMQQTIANQMSTIEASQNELANHVDSQEGLMNKVLRQLDHLRSILYERTHFLEDKIEKVSEYFNKIYSKS